MIHRIRIAIKILVERQRYGPAARVLIHRDKAPRAGVIVPGP